MILGAHTYLKYGEVIVLVFCDLSQSPSFRVPLTTEDGGRL